MKLYQILIVVLLLSGTTQLNAQTKESIQITENSIEKKGRYAMLVMKAQHLQAAIKTGISLKSKSAKIDFQLLVCGELVKEISLNKDLQNQINDAVKTQGIKVLVCGLSIQQFKIDATLLPDGMALTVNGLIYMFGLQEQGYNTLIL